MKPGLLLIPAAACAVLASCSAPSGITTRQVAAMNRPAGDMPSRVTIQMSVKEGKAAAKPLPAKQVTVGSDFRITAQREFVYPSSYEPASAHADLTTVVPATPKEFQSIPTGIEADLETERSGGLIVIKGMIKVTEFQGFSRMGGLLGQPILNAKGQVITENRIEMPKLATYTTPVYAAVQPDGTCAFEISHPKKGTVVTLSLAPAR